MNFLCSLELGEDVSKGTMVKLFKENLGKAEMLRYVHVFNIPHWSEELEFVFGQKDMDQWKVGPASRKREMLDTIPIQFFLRIDP